MQFAIGSEQRPLRVAIIGSGPAAFYAAADLLKQDAHIDVDMFERLPTPYGLVRGGVAPDHQKIKNVARIYERTALRSQFRFWGNVTYGKDISREELLQHYDSLIYAVGSQSDRQMGIAGEDLIGSYSATEFVGWYNGHPDYRDRTFDLSVDSVAVIGMGNVAVDVARILAKTPAELAHTDMADYAQEALKQSQVRKIYMIARRGPVQAAFTPPEARELLELEQTVTLVDPEVLKLDPASENVLQTTKHKDVVRNIEIMRKMAQFSGEEKPRQLYLMFQYSPVEILEEDGRVSGIKLVKNELLQDEGGRIKARPVDEFEEMPVGLVFRSIGYQGVPLPGVPFDERKGVIPNQGGRVMDAESNSVRPREYVVGWAKRGPSGVIGTNKPDAGETVRALLVDYMDREAEANEAFKPEAVEALLKTKNIAWVSFADWKILDDAEIEAGSSKGKPREKFTKIDAMMRRIK